MKRRNSQEPRPEFFQLEEESEAVNEAVTEALRAIQTQFVRQRLSEENTLHYTHGTKWSNRAGPVSQDGEFQAHSAEWATPFQALVDGDISLIPRFVEHMSKEMQAQFMSMVYSTVGKACEASGNTVSAQTAGSFSAAFLEMLRKIEFGVNRDGTVSMPELHVGSDPQKLIAELEAQPPEYHAEFERLKAEKIAAALERERQRKSRFRTIKQ